MSDEVLHGDDPARPGNLSAAEYRAEYEQFVADHPEAGRPIPADQYRLLPEDDQ